MTSDEREFLENVEDAVRGYKHNVEYYYEDSYDGRYFTVMVTFDENEWHMSNKKIWDTLVKVSKKWRTGMDDEGNYCIGLSLRIG